MSNLSINNLLAALSNGVKPLWTITKVAAVLRTQSDPVMSGYILEKHKELEELTYLMNEGYIDVVSGLYRPVSFTNLPEGFSERFEVVTKLEEQYIEEVKKKGMLPVYKAIDATTTDSFQTRIKMVWYQRLVEMGSESIEIGKLNYSLYAQDLKVMVKSGQVSGEKLLESFKNGLERFFILPYNTKASTDYYYIELIATEKYKEYLKNKQKHQEELKTLFMQPKGKKTIEFPLNDYLEKKNAGTYEEDDLVVFTAKGKELRGILLAELPAGEEGLEIAQDVFEQQKERYEEIAWSKQPQLRFFKKSTNYFKHKWLLPDKPFEEKRWLVNSPHRTSKGETMSYYAITEKDILGALPFKDFSAVVSEVFNRNTDPDLQLAKANEEATSENYNAKYSWEQNCIALHISNSLDLIYNRFLHQGISAYVTLELLIAHELGHSDKDSRYLMPELHLNTQNYNKVGAKVKELEDKNKMSFYVADVEASKELEKELKKAIPLFEKFIEVDSKAEQDAFKNGLKYVSEPYQEFFKQISYIDYLSHEESNKRQLIAIYNRLYNTIEANLNEATLGRWRSGLKKN